MLVKKKSLDWIITESLKLKLCRRQAHTYNLEGDIYSSDIGYRIIRHFMKTQYLEITFSLVSQILVVELRKSVFLELVISPQNCQNYRNVTKDFAKYVAKPCLSMILRKRRSNGKSLFVNSLLRIKTFNERIVLLP